MSTPARSLRLAAALFPVLAAPAAAQSLLALTTDNRLVPLRAGAPLVVGPATPITGLQPGEAVLGIDFRPANGRLYGLSSLGRVLGIDPRNGAAFPVGAPIATALAGAEFGFDFNPVVDRIRVVGDTGQNLRLHPDTGALVATDGSLAFAANDPNAGLPPQVGASAYTNSVAGASTTTLFGIDAYADVLVTQVPPNSGTLNTVGSLGRDVTSVAGFDIAPNGVAYAALNTAGATSGTTQIFTVDLTSGATTWQGVVATTTGSSRLRGLTVVPPQPDGEAIVLTTDGRLARFDLATPWLAPGFATVTGLQAGEELLGIDFRPATGQLYGLGSTSRLYVLDATTGAATAIGSPFTTPLAGTVFGFDFNPTVDRIRIVSDTEQNLRVHPDTGAVAAVDMPLAYALGDPGAASDPAIAGAAYTNALPGAASTLLYGIDVARDVLVTQVPPNNGTLNTVGALGHDVVGAAGFDVGSDGRAFAVLHTATAAFLAQVELRTGAAIFMADLGLATGSGLRGLAVRPAAGLAAFGAATNGCAGPIWLGAAGTPFAGSSLFTLTSTNGPANNLGFFVLGIAPLTTPMSFGGVMSYLDPTMVIGMWWDENDHHGTGAVPFPLMSAWFGLDLYFQWVGFEMCGPQWLATSAGLKVTVQ